MLQIHWLFSLKGFNTLAHGSAMGLIRPANLRPEGAVYLIGFKN